MKIMKKNKIYIYKFKNTLKDNIIYMYIHFKKSIMEYFSEFDNVVVDEFDINEEKRYIKSLDRGYCQITRPMENKYGRIKLTKIDLYTSGVIGSNIRNAVTGEYYDCLVGTKDEDLFFKVKLSTGECCSKNCSNTLFYYSPEEFEKYDNMVELDESVKELWRLKRKLRLNERRNHKKYDSTVVK